MVKENIWERLSVVPKTHLKAITGGRLKGKTDINPQWRIKIMTEVFGRCGEGWKHEKTDRWTEKTDAGEIMCFYEVAVYVWQSEEKKWGDPVVGTGGDFIVKKEKSGLVSNDEGYKMAYTDALGTALKSLGVASSIYEGLFDGSKYNRADADQKASREHLDPMHPSWAEAIQKKAGGMSFEKMNMFFEVTEENWELLG